MPGSDRVRIFIYGLQLSGEREHPLLGDAEFLGEARTAPRYTLVDLSFYPALLTNGRTAIKGELYAVSKKIRFSLDVHHQCPALFHSVEIVLEDGGYATTYAMGDEQVRGKRRLPGGSWRERFAPRPRSGPPNPFVLLARQRSGRG